MKEGQLYVAFVVAGYYEWYNKNLPNVLQSGYDDMVLTLCKSPPSNIINREPTSEDDVTNLFCKSKKGWLVKSHEAQCYGCGDPWCLLHNDRKRLKGVITTIGTWFRSTPKQKRYRCYSDAVANKWGVLGYQQRKYTGWCFENAVGIVFPDESFTGYKEVSTEMEIEFFSVF